MLGGHEVAAGRTTLGSLDPSLFPAVPSHCRWSLPVLRLLPFVSILPSYLGCLIVGWSGTIFCLILASCLRLPLKSEPLQEVSLAGGCVPFPCPHPLARTPGLLRVSSPCTPARVSCCIGGVGLTFQLASALACSRGPWIFLTDLKISCHVILRLFKVKNKYCFEISLAVLFPSELLGSSSMTNYCYSKHFSVHQPLAPCLMQ